jgi:protein-tyrosine-phosphatase
MAEAIARRDASDVIIPESAGLHPLGFIDKTAIAVLTERGISVAGQHSKGLRDHTLSEPDLIINMSGAPSSKLFPLRKFEDWPVEDPFGESMALHRRICDDIEARVKDLAGRLRTEAGAAR